MPFFTSAKGNPDSQEVTPAEKATQHRHLDSPRKRETL